MPVPILSIVGRSSSGKTTLLENLIPVLKTRGYKVATIKHNLHDFEIDQPGKDTWKHQKAGADTVIISSPLKLAIIEKIEEELSLQELAKKIQEVDLVLTEGFKREQEMKIEVIRGNDQPVCTQKEGLWALVINPESGSGSEVPVSFRNAGLPIFLWNQLEKLVDAIEQEFLRG